MPIVVMANDDYSIENSQVYIYINDEGNAHVVETISYKFNKNLKGITKTIFKKGFNKIDNLKAYEIYPEKKELETEVFNDTNVFDCRIYDESKAKSKIFKIEYDLNSAVNTYKDANEFYFKYIDENNKSIYKNLNLYIVFPKDIKSNEFQIFQHGYLFKKFEIKKNMIVSNITSFPLDTELEIRILFPKDIIEKTDNFINIYEYNKIISIEKSLEKEVDKKVFYIKTYNKVSIHICILEFILFIITSCMIRKNRKYSVRRYYTKPPMKYSPGVISCIFHYKKIYPMDMIATLMNLVRKKYVYITKINDDKNNYILELINEDLSDLELNEQYFVNWLFYSMGQNKRISLKELEDINRYSKNFMKFKSYYCSWKESLLKECIEIGYLKKKHNFLNILLTLLCMIQIILGIFGIYKYINYTKFYIFYIVSGILLFLLRFELRRTILGNREYANLKQLKKFLLKFKSDKLIKVNSLHVWEYYLICSISFGIYKKISSRLKYILKKENIFLDESSTLRYLLDSNLIDLLHSSFRTKDLNKKNYKEK